MQDFHPFGSPTRQTQSHASTSIDSNPFSNPRLFQNASPARHTSPYHLAYGTNGNGNTTSTETDAAVAILLGPSGQGRLQSDLTRLSIGGLDSSLAASSTAAYTSFGSPAATAVSSPNRYANHSPHQLASGASAEDPYYFLLKSAREGDVPAVQTLFASHPQLDVNFADRDGDTALHRAAAGGHLGMVHSLVLDFHADIHQVNHLGETSLLVNAKSGTSMRPEVLKFLIECGSDVHATNKAGMNTLALAAPSASPTNAFGSFPPNNTLQQSLQEAHNSPTRKFVLLQRQLLEQRAQTMQEQLAQIQTMRSQLSSQESQLRGYYSTLTNGVVRLQNLDTELERAFVQQQEFQRQQQQQQQQGGQQPSQQPILSQPQVLISEVRQALNPVRAAFNV